MSNRLTAEKRGRPLILGELDAMVQTYIKAASNRGAVVTRSMAEATAKALMVRYPGKVGKIDLENSQWAKSLFVRMGYTRRKATTAKLEWPAGLRKEAELLFYHEIVEHVETNDIPDSLILNFDQTPYKYVPVASTTLAKRNSKQVSIKGSDDRRAITGTFTITLDGKFLGMQLIYGGKTNQSLPRFQFPENFYSNEQESIKLIDEIIIPYVNSERKIMQRPDQVALVIFDVFRGQITDAVMKKYKENNIVTVFVPANMTGLLQPLDLTVNGFAKKFCKKKFNHWYMDQISKQLDSGKAIEEVEVKLQLTMLKPLHAEWLTELYNHMTKLEGKEVIVNGWKAAGIWQAIKDGANQLESIDPFSDLDALLPQVSDAAISLDVIQEEEKQAFLDQNEDDDESEDDEFFLPGDDDRNIFDLFDEAEGEED